MNNLQSLVLEAPDEFISGLLSIVFFQYFELEAEELTVFPEDPGVWYLCAAPSGCHLTGPAAGHVEGNILVAFRGSSRVTLAADQSGPVYAAALKGRVADEILGNAQDAPILYYPDFAMRLQALFSDFTSLEKSGGRRGIIPAKEASSKAYDILMSMYGMASEEEAVSRRLPVVVSTALLMIHEEYAYLEGIAEVAERVEVSQEYLTRSFKKYLGVTPARYLTRIRLERAKQMLQQGDYPVSLIAETCGFAGSNYFIKVFTESTGMTPGKYKKEFAGRGLPGNKEPEDYYVL